MIRLIALALSIFVISSCTGKKDQKELWVYTSLYKDTIADLKPQLKEDFPDAEIKFFQAGSEEIAAKVNSEIAAGNLRADVLISSDRFWYEEMAQNGNLVPIKSDKVDKVPASMKNASDFYATLSIPVMVLIYNKEAITDAPKTFKELADPKWKEKFTTGSPLSSGTNFTTVAMLQSKYGWEYVKALKSNDTIAQGGNSAVIRRVQSKERPVGWVLLENALRFQNTDKRLQIVYPEDGVVMQSNVMAITKKEDSRDLAQKFADWMYGNKGQMAMIQSFMYSPFPEYEPPKGAPPLSNLNSKNFEWTQEFLKNTVRERMNIKEKYAEIMYQ